MSGFIIGLAIASVTTAYLCERIGPIKVLTIYKAPGDSVDVPLLPPTRWALLVATVKRAATVGLAAVGLAGLLGVVLGGCS
jgi:hypothetical protein